MRRYQFGHMQIGLTTASTPGSLRTSVAATRVSCHLPRPDLNGLVVVNFGTHDDAFMANRRGSQ